MLNLKACLHLHVQGDPIENIRYTNSELIEFANQHNFEVLAVTTHNKFIDCAELQNLGNKYGIIIIPGIEQTIEKRHVIILNCDKSIEAVKTFKQLKQYKQQNPNCCIIAPHPFHMLPNCLGKDLIKNIELFDAVEWNYFYSELINPNKKVAKVARKYKKPVVATSDVHILKHMPRCYSHIKAKDKSIDQILNAIKKGQLENNCMAFKTLELPVALFEIFQNTK